MHGIRTIGRLAQEVGVNVETIRFYERQGLLVQPKSFSGPRHYDDGALARLRYIRVGQSLGLTLREIKELAAKLTDENSFCASLRTTAQMKLGSIAVHRAELDRLETELKGFLGRCAARDQSLPCPIVEELTRLDSAVAHPKTRNNGGGR